MTIPEISTHTRMINVIISLLTPNNLWPSPLYDAGFELLAIEEVFNIGRTGNNPCSPDVISVNRKDSWVLLVECKGGRNIEMNQLQRYLEVKPSDIEMIVTVDDADKLEVEFAYTIRDHTSFRDSLQRTFEDMNKEFSANPNDVMTIEVTRDTITIHNSTYEHWPSDLLHGIDVSDITFPHTYYPFSGDDDPEWILSYIVRGMISLINKQETIIPGELRLTEDQLVDQLFETYPYISSTKRNKLTRLVGKYLNQIVKEGKLKGVIKRLATRGRPISIRDIDKALNLLQVVAEEIRQGQSQTTLFDFSENGSEIK